MTIIEKIDINVRHITRVEGHGNLVVMVRNGVLEQCDLEISESPRYFEALLRGQPYNQASKLASRICGICAVAHTTTSLRAIEKALGVELSPQSESLRQLSMWAETLDSHILHVFMLVAPDLFSVGSVVPLVKSAPEVVTRALRMKKVAGDICKVFLGRHTHPIAMTVGGFAHFPKTDELHALGERLEAMREDIEATVALFEGLSLPDFERDTEYLALYQEGDYPFIAEEVASSDGGFWPVEEYKRVTNEFQVTHSTAKHARHKRSAYMVGALARFNLNYGSLHPNARAAASALNLVPKCTNPFMNTIAQVVEIVHCYEETLALIRRLASDSLECEPLAQPARYSGEGVGACEAPRGTLYHHYVIRNGYIAEANCIIPTGQNLANIEADMRALVSKMLRQPGDEVRHKLEMLVRAYDPCISCSTH